MRATLGKDDGKSVRINVPTKFSHLFYDSQILYENLYSAVTFFRCIFLLREVYIFEIYVKFCVFWYLLSPHCEEKKMFGPLYSAGTNKSWHLRKRSFDPITFFAIFHTFTSRTTDLCLPFVKNVKSQKSTHPVICWINITFLGIFCHSRIGMHHCRYIAFHLDLRNRYSPLRLL
jgi:hypothetical protein